MWVGYLPFLQILSLWGIVKNPGNLTYGLMKLELSELEIESYFLYPNYPWVCSVGIVAPLFCATLICILRNKRRSIVFLPEASTWVPSQITKQTLLS